MSKLEQFDKIINGFEQELDKLQNTSKVYQKINELYNQNLQKTGRLKATPFCLVISYVGKLFI